MKGKCAFDDDKRMKKLLAILGMSIGGWLGWQIGGLVSLFTAFIVSVIGAGVGSREAVPFVVEGT